MLLSLARDRAGDRLHERQRILDFLQRKTLRLVTQQQKFAARHQPEHFAGALRDHHLPALPHAHDPKNMLAIRRNRITKRRFIVIHQIIDAHAEQLRQRAHIIQIRRCLARLPLRHRLPRHTKLFGQALLRETLVLTKRANILRNHTFPTSTLSVSRRRRALNHLNMTNNRRK